MSSPKRASLAAALQRTATRGEPDSAAAPAQSEATERTSAARATAGQRWATPAARVGKKTIAGHFDPAVSTQLKRIGLDQDRSVQELLREAINDLFTKHGKPPIA